MAKIEQGARVLVLADEARAAAIRARAPHATVLTDAASLSRIEGKFDAALVDGLLEDEAWDRWVLQRVHRLLRMDARIVVAVPPLLSLGSATDLRFLAYVSRKLVARLVEPWTHGWRVPGGVHRRYHVPRLVSEMDSLGFTSIQAGTSWLARRASVTARKAPSLAGVGGRRWPDAQLHGRNYAEQYSATLAASNAWLARFPELRALTARALEPADWRHARVLVLAPHPDDELVGCGGTLCRLLSAGAQVSILQATEGSGLASLRDLPEGRRRSVRLEEAGRVAAALGAELVLWRQEDGRLRCTGSTIAELARLLGEMRPTHVFTPFLGDLHADHRALSGILSGALAAVSLEPQVLQYEVWGRVPANLYCETTDQAERLESLLLLYERAMAVDDFVHFCEIRNRARGAELTGRPAYVEAFLCTASAEYRRVAQCLQ